MDRDINFDAHFPLPSGNTPIIGQEPRPVIMTINIFITPKLMKKLTEWQDKLGIPINEIGGTIARIGLIELSKRIDDPEDQVNNPERYLGPPQGLAE